MLTGSFSQIFFTGSLATGSFSQIFFTGSLAYSAIAKGMPSAANISTKWPDQKAPVSKRIKIPWKIYQFSDIKGDKGKSQRNAKVIGEALQRWWESFPNVDSNGGARITALRDVSIIHFHVVIDNVPIKYDGKIIEKLGILPIATFDSATESQIKDNDFVFRGTMKISKTDPDELVQVNFSDVEVRAGRYEM
jgi:hypothetical protein